MGEIRSQLISDGYWATDPSLFPKVEWETEQANSLYYRKTVGDAFTSVHAYPDPQVRHLRTAERLAIEGAVCLSVVLDQRISGAPDELERIVAAHPLGEAAFLRDEDVFDIEAEKLTRLPDYRGLGAGLWVPEDQLLIRRSRLTLLPSYVGDYLIGAESYKFALEEDLTDAGVDLATLGKKNVVLPPLIVGDVYVQAPRSRRLERLAKVASAQAISPPEDVMAGIIIPRQREDE